MNERREDAKSSDPQNRISMRISQKRGAGLSKSRDTRRSRLIGSHQNSFFPDFFKKSMVWKIAGIITVQFEF